MWRRVPARSRAAGAGRARRFSRYQATREGGRLSAVLLEQRAESRQCAVTLGEANAIDGKVIDQSHVEHMLGVATVAHAGGGLARDPQEGPEGARILREEGLGAQI